MAIAVFQKLGKTFKRNNRLGHTHAFGIAYKAWNGKEIKIASWGSNETHAKQNLANRLGVEVKHLSVGLHSLAPIYADMGERKFEVLETELVEVI